MNFFEIQPNLFMNLTEIKRVGFKFYTDYEPDPYQGKVHINVEYATGEGDQETFYGIPEKIGFNLIKELKGGK